MSLESGCLSPTIKVKHLGPYKGWHTNPFTKEVTCPELAQIECHKESSQKQDSG